MIEIFTESKRNFEKFRFEKKWPNRNWSFRSISQHPDYSDWNNPRLDSNQES